MDNEIIIKPASSDDLESIFRLVCELENMRFDFDAFGLIYDKNIRNPENYYFVAVVIDKIVGFISYHTQDLLHHCGRVGEIQELFVDKDYRNKGIGKSLMNEIYRISNINNIKSIEVTSNVKRIENIDVYQKLGFAKTHNKFTK